MDFPCQVGSTNLGLPKPFYPLYHGPIYPNPHTLAYPLTPSTARSTWVYPCLVFRIALTSFPPHPALSHDCRQSSCPQGVTLFFNRNLWININLGQQLTPPPPKKKRASKWSERAFTVKGMSIPPFPCPLKSYCSVKRSHRTPEGGK